MRARLPLVAALLVVAVVAGVVVGDRVFRDWNARHAVSPGAHALPTLAELEARPLVDLVGPTGLCAGFKDGPVEFKNPTARFIGDKAVYASGEAFTYAGVEGLVLSRIRDARTGQPTIFYINDNSAGAVLGTDVVGGQAVEMRPEIVFDTAHPHGGLDSIGRRGWNVTWGWLPSHSGCTVVQSDGTFKGQEFVEFSIYEG